MGVRMYRVLLDGVRKKVVRVPFTALYDYGFETLKIGEKSIIEVNGETVLTKILGISKRGKIMKRKKKMLTVSRIKSMLRRGAVAIRYKNFWKIFKSATKAYRYAKNFNNKGIKMVIRKSASGRISRARTLRFAKR